MYVQLLLDSMQFHFVVISIEERTEIVSVQPGTKQPTAQNWSLDQWLRTPVLIRTPNVDEVITLVLQLHFNVQNVFSYSCSCPFSATCSPNYLSSLLDLCWL